MTWNHADLLATPGVGAALRPGEPGYDGFAGDVVQEGHPDLVARPTQESEVSDLLAYAADRGIPVTPAGGLSGLTGAGTTEEGILLSTRGLHGVVDLRADDPAGPCVVVRPGGYLGDLQRELAADGWMYPPDPTSRNEACLGGTVATNATGEDTLQYGPTRRWVRALRCVTADGSVRTLERPGPGRPSEEKATAGYFLDGDEIDLLIGSEGTLGVLTELTLDLAPVPAVLVSGLAFFPDLRHALEFVVAARQTEGIRPRALELYDRHALDMVEDNQEGVRWPAETGAAIYFKQEARDEAERDRRLAVWLELAERHAGTAPVSDRLVEALVVAEDGPGRERLRTFRHRVPASLHERVRPYPEQGGAKIGTDWWIPFTLIPDHLESWRRTLDDSGLDYVLFGHIGNGHPHVNLLPRTAAETTRAQALVHEMCRDAVRLGGGVAGEHGLGKRKRDLLELQSPGSLPRMRAVKQAWDPRWILGRGNLFLPETS